MLQQCYHNQSFQGYGGVEKHRFGLCSKLVQRVHSQPEQHKCLPAAANKGGKRERNRRQPTPAEAVCKPLGERTKRACAPHFPTQQAVKVRADMTSAVRQSTSIAPLRRRGARWACTTACWGQRESSMATTTHCSVDKMSWGCSPGPTCTQVSKRKGQTTRASSVQPLDEFARRPSIPAGFSACAGLTLARQASQWQTTLDTGGWLGMHNCLLRQETQGNNTLSS